MVLANVNIITLLVLTIVGISSAATGNANLRRSIATEDDKNKLSYTTATLNDITNNNKHTLRQLERCLIPRYGVFMLVQIIED